MKKNANEYGLSYHGKRGFPHQFCQKKNKAFLVIKESMTSASDAKVNYYLRAYFQVMLQCQPWLRLQLQLQLSLQLQLQALPFVRHHLALASHVSSSFSCRLYRLHVTIQLQLSLQLQLWLQLRAFGVFIGFRLYHAWPETQKTGCTSTSYPKFLKISRQWHRRTSPRTRAAIAQRSSTSNSTFCRTVRAHISQ